MKIAMPFGLICLSLGAGFDRGLNQEAARWNSYLGVTYGIGRFMHRPNRNSPQLLPTAHSAL